MANRLSDPETAAMPRLSLFTMFQLGLFQMGLGMMSVLLLGVLNRVMIKELAIPATIAAGAIAVHQFMAPARLWFGQLSDAKTIGGYHRTGYVWIGSALFATAAFLAVQVMWQLGDSVQAVGWALPTQLWAVALGGVFAIYGLALSSGSTPFAALLVDVSDEDQRSQLVGIVWSMLMVGIVIGAIISSKLLPGAVNCFELGKADLTSLRAGMNRLFTVVPGVVFGLTLLATWGVEKRYSRFGRRSTTVVRDDQVTFGRALRVLTASPQTGLFFSFLLFMTISLFLQDPVLESYGGQVFGMCVGDTTKLNAFWGTGTLIGISVAGFVVVPKLGKERTTKLGCIGVALCAGLLILAGFSANQSLLKSAVLLFGLASGITTTGALNLMLDLTVAETAGTFIGAWGLAQAMARGLATVLGGGLLDLGRGLFGSNVMLAYALVFGVQAVGMIAAIALLSRLNLQEFRTTAQAAIATVFQSDLD
jgi:MFS transporter, BCD family, chlorophyll transporter